MAHPTVPAIYLTATGSTEPQLYEGARTAHDIYSAYQALELGANAQHVPKITQPSLYSRVEAAKQNDVNLLEATRRGLLVARKHHKQPPAQLRTAAAAWKHLQTGGRVDLVEQQADKNKPKPVLTTTVLQPAGPNDTVQTFEQYHAPK